MSGPFNPSDRRDELADKLSHWSNPAAFDPATVEAMTEAQERYYQAPAWKLIWWKFRRHKLALISFWFLLFLYVAVCFVEILAPYNLKTRNSDYLYAPPQALHFFHDGEFVGPFVYGLQYELNMETLKREYTEDTSRVQPLRFFCSGDAYSFWGMVEMDVHLVCPAEGGTLSLLGTDRLGRDVLSRIIYGARISLTIGLVGIAFSFVLGIAIGGGPRRHPRSGHAGIQRLIEIVRSFPEIPLWLALSAILPVTWSPLWVFFGITLILALLDWPGLARAVRSKLLSLREEDFAVAAQLMGASPKRIIFRHLMPSFSSHLIASLTLSIPGMILAETALSFLGLGLRPPITSWGVLLTEAQSISVVELYPWLLLPAVPVIVTVLAFNFLGDGLRDAADPYR